MHESSLPKLFWIARYYVAAILLILPGILSDILALSFLIPWKGKIARPVLSKEIIEAEFTQEASPLFDPIPMDETTPRPHKHNKS